MELIGSECCVLFYDKLGCSVEALIHGDFTHDIVFKGLLYKSLYCCIVY